jgi:hypothetical protein
MSEKKNDGTNSAEAYIDAKVDALRVETRAMGHTFKEELVPNIRQSIINERDNHETSKRKPSNLAR